MKEIAAASEFSTATANGTVLIDFSAEWCGPCKAMLPMIQKLAGEYGDKLHVYSVDIDKSPELAASQGVMSVPTFVVYRGGRPVERIVGAINERDLRKKLDPHLGA